MDSPGQLGRFAPVCRGGLASSIPDSAKERSEQTWHSGDRSLRLSERRKSGAELCISLNAEAPGIGNFANREPG